MLYYHFFVSRISGRITEQEFEEYEKLAEEYFGKRRDYFKDMLKFIVYLKDKPPKTAYGYFNVAKTFLEYNRVGTSLF